MVEKYPEIQKEIPLDTFELSWNNVDANSIRIFHLNWYKIRRIISIYPITWKIDQNGRKSLFRSNIVRKLFQRISKKIFVELEREGGKCRSMSMNQIENPFERRVSQDSDDDETLGRRPTSLVCIGPEAARSPFPPSLSSPPLSSSSSSSFRSLQDCR